MCVTEGPDGSFTVSDANVCVDEKKHVIEITVTEEDAFRIPWIVVAANGEHKAMPLSSRPVLTNLLFSSENYGNLTCLAVEMANAHVNYCKV